MPTPSGTISLSDVNEELRESSSASISMSDTNVRKLARDESGAISMSSLRNKSIVTGAGTSVGPVGGTNSTTAGLQWEDNGTLQTIENGNLQGQFSNFWSFLFDNTVPKTGADYDLYVSQGSTFGSPQRIMNFSINTWVSLDTNRKLEIKKPFGSGLATSTFTAKIREADTTTEVANATFTLSVDVIV